MNIPSLCRTHQQRQPIPELRPGIQHLSLVAVPLINPLHLILLRGGLPQALEREITQKNRRLGSLWEMGNPAGNPAGKNQSGSGIRPSFTHLAIAFCTVFKATDLPFPSPVNHAISSPFGCTTGMTSRGPFFFSHRIAWRPTAPPRGRDPTLQRCSLPTHQRLAIVSCFAVVADLS